MTISTSASKVVCLGNGMTTQFAFNFLIPLSGQEVIIYTDALGNQTTLPNSLYTVLGFGNPAGGTVIYPLIGSPIATGTSLTIARVLPLVQTTSISNQGAFYPNVVEAALDYLTMEVQQVQQGSNQAIKIPVVDNIVLNALPPAAQRANMLLSFDSSGQPVAVQPAAPVNLQSWANVVRAAGFDTWVASPTSAHLLTLMADKTGTGELVFANSPTLSAPIFAGGTSGQTILAASNVASGTLTLPAATDTLVGRNTTDTLTNKTFDTAGAGNSLLINGLAATANTGTGPVVRGTGPAVDLTNATGLPLGGSGVTGTLTVPNGGIGVATLTGIAKGNGTAAFTAAVAGTDYIAPGGASYPASVGGRLTNVTGTPINGTGAAGATSVFFTPYKGAHIPIWNGSTFADVAFTSDLTQTLADTTKSPAAAAANSVYDIYAWMDSGTLRISRGPAWSTLNVRGAGANVTTFRGIVVNVSAITNGPASLFGTYLGSIATNASATLDFIHGGSASGGSAASLMVWNYYNRVINSDFVFDNGASYTYSTSTWRQARASTGNQIKFLTGLQEEGYSMFYQQNVATTAVAGSRTLYGISVGAGALSIVAAAGNQVIAPTANAFAGSVPVFWSALPGIGVSIMAGIEWGDGTNANSICTFGGAQLSFSMPM